MPNETVYLPVIIDGTTRHISGVTKSTTCSDVIKKVHTLPGVEQDDLHSLALFESSYGIERMLPGKTKILKVWRDWQTGTNNVRFVLRKAESAPKVSYAKRKMLHQRAKAARAKPYTMATSNLRRIFTSLPKLQECSKNKDVAVSKDQLDYIKDIYLKDLDESDTQHITKVGKVTDMSRSGNCGQVKLARRKSITKLSRGSLYQQVKFAVTKNLGKITTTAHQANREQRKSLGVQGLTEERVRHHTLIDVPSHLSNQTEGKQDILRRYLDGYVPYRRSGLKACRRQLFYRDSGDGQEQTVYGFAHVQGDGTEVVSSPLPLSRAAPSPPSPIRRDLNLAFLDGFQDLTDNMVSGHIEVQSGRDAVIRKQSRLIDDFVYRHGLVDYSGSEEEEDCSLSVSSRRPYNSASHLLSSSESVHDRIASLLNTCIVNGASEEELSSANSDDMSV